MGFQQCSSYATVLANEVKKIYNKQILFSFKKPIYAEMDLQGPGFEPGTFGLLFAKLSFPPNAHQDAAPLA